MKASLIKFVESVIDNGGRIREHTVFAHLPLPVVQQTDALVSSHPHMARGAALWFVLTGRSVPDCASCGKPLKFSMWSDRREHGYKLRKDMHCSSKCYGKNCKKGSNIQDRREATNLERYGASMPQQNEDLKRKQQKTMLKRYGVAFAGQNPESIAKREQSALARHGKNWRQLAHAKSKETMMERYGVESWAHSREFFERSQAEFRIKEVTVGGKVFRVRGYEPKAIQILHNQGVPVKDILTTAKEGVPSIIWNISEDGTRSVYHPDMMVKWKGKWTLIEVKSDYTCGLKRNRQMWLINKKKFAATAKEGYTLKLMVIVRGKAKLFDEPHLQTVPSLRRALGLRPPRSRQP